MYIRIECNASYKLKIIWLTMCTIENSYYLHLGNYGCKYCSQRLDLPKYENYLKTTLGK